MIRALPAYLLAALIALSGAAGVLVAVGGATFPLGGIDMPYVYVLPPLVALALFQLIFGSTTGRWRGLRFWALALPVSAAIWGAGLVLLLEAQTTAVQALIGVAAAHVAAGLIALLAGRHG